MTQIIKYKTSYLIFIKWDEEPIEVSNEAWELLKKDINNLTFVHINGGVYNKFEITKIIPKKDFSLNYEEIRKEKLKRLHGEKWEDFI